MILIIFIIKAFIHKRELIILNKMEEDQLQINFWRRVLKELNQIDLKKLDEKKVIEKYQTIFNLHYHYFLIDFPELNWDFYKSNFMDLLDCMIEDYEKDEKYELCSIILKAKKNIK
jgi:hypothetical protein